MENLPNEMLIEILLKTNTKNELMKICSTSKRIYNLCKTETVAKHIIKNLIKLKKPDVFNTYRGFLKHYLVRAKTLHPDTIKYDSYDFYNRQLPETLKSKGQNYLENFRKKFN
jgi:hypothetical protein